jgi:flagellar basal-body rod protein FlgB
MDSLLGINFSQAINPTMQVIGGITQMQQATSSNIVNANTPGYKAKHVSFSAVLEQASSPFETSLSQQMGGGMVATLLGEAASGGQVNLQREMMTMQENLMNFNLASRHLRTVVTNIRTVSNVGK